MKRLTLLTFLLLLTTVSFLHAQEVGFGIRAGFSGAPAALSITDELAPNQHLEMYVGHTKISAPADNSGLFDRGALVFGANYQPRVNFGGRRMDGGAGLYANLGARLRYHLGMAAQRDGEMTMNSEEGYTLTPDVLAGGGLFVRLGQSLELFGEMNAAYRSPEGRKMSMGVETAMGLKIFF